MEKKDKKDLITRDQAIGLTTELKRCWHKLGQLHLRLYNGIDTNEAIYMTKSQTKRELSDIKQKLDELSREYLDDPN